MRILPCSLSFLVALAHAAPAAPADNYVVDLGYQLNQGITVATPNTTLLTYRNIRYASPPLSDLRFSPPQSPPVNRSIPFNVSDVICPQPSPPPSGPRPSEDCLFLDVLLPLSVWQARNEKQVPVIAWIHGGGWESGAKDASGRGNGLVARSADKEAGEEEVVLVSLNYRLGLFGWMYGDGITSNLGLLDQRFALEWVQDHVHLFGGDPNRVTIMGESAGGSSVEAHITAYGGAKGCSPFVGAIPQSPANIPATPPEASSVENVLKEGNVTSLEELREMDSGDLQKLNLALINQTLDNLFTFIMSVDGDYVPDYPTLLLQQGRFDRTLAIMTGHNQDEGPNFIPNGTVATDEASYQSALALIFPELQIGSESLNYTTGVLYPPVFDGSYGYVNQTERLNLTTADARIVCAARDMDDADFTRETYAYEFSVPPALHGTDLSYTFYDFGDVPAVVNQTVAEVLQRYIIQFAGSRQPNEAGLPYFPPTKKGPTVQNLGNDFVGPMADERGIDLLGERCQSWRNVQSGRSCR